MDSTLSEKEPETVPTGGPPREQKRRRHGRSRRKRWFRGIPAPWVFYTIALFAVGSLGLIQVKGDRFLPLAAVASVLAALSLFINDRKGFIRKRQMRRAYEARRNFTNVEVALLIALILGNIYVAVRAYFT